MGMLLFGVYKGADIRFYLMIVLFLNFFMKSCVVGTHYNHLVDKILICYNSNSFYEDISKELSESFYCMPFLSGDRCTKDSLDSAGKKKQLTITY